MNRLRWVPTGKILTSCTSKADSESTHGSNVDISKIHECKQTLDLSAGTSINVQKEQSFDLNTGDEESEESEEEVKEEEEEDDLEYFNIFITREELEYHEWLLNNP
ncbi:hypothetical protein Tco_0558355 [Tanacetum coccineum]